MYLRYGYAINLQNDHSNDHQIMKILVVEDQLPLLEQISNLLQHEGYVCERADRFISAQDRIISHEYDLVIVDLNLPGGSGLELVRMVKSDYPQTGIIIISARDALVQKIEGLDLGADDYITKPFALPELLARVKSVFRRSSFRGEKIIQYGDIRLDPDRQEVSVRNEPIELTRTEYKMLLFFLSNPGRVLSRDNMAEHVWGDHMDLADSYDFIYSHIKNLRKKIRGAGGTDPIKVVYGVGYRLKTM